MWFSPKLPQFMHEIAIKTDDDRIGCRILEFPKDPE